MSFSKKPKVVVFGAGATGRGHVGLLAWQAGADVVFVDIDEALVQQLQSSGGYRVNLYEGNHCETIDVQGARFLRAQDRATVASELVDADLVLTAVFDQNLEDVARTVAMAVPVCRGASRTRPSNLVCCENMQNSSSTLGKHVRAQLRGTDLDWCESYLGFPDCMISRVVPRPEPNPLVITAENYNEWTARRSDFRGPGLAWFKALQLVDNQDARLERKLFMHNGGHAVCGYFGFHYGHEFIHQAVGDSRVVERVVRACDEIGEVVRIRHGFSSDEIREYKEDLYRRGAISQMRDQVLRVVRQPLRKLGRNERLIGPACLALEYGLPRRGIVEGIIAALKYSHPSDPQSAEMHKILTAEGPGGLVTETCHLKPDHPIIKEIEQAWTNWKL